MKSKFGIILTIFLVFFYSCGKKNSAFNSDFSLFKEYIKSFSPGLISSNQDIRVVLNFTKSDWTPETNLDQDLFEISPSVAGKVVVISNNSVAFIPEKKLENGVSYQVTFHLHKLIKTPKKLEEFCFTVQTIKQDFIVNTLDLQSYNNEWQYLNGEIKFADAINYEDAIKIIKASQNDNDKLNIRFNKDLSSATEIKFIIDSIQRQQDDSTGEISWDGSLMAMSKFAAKNGGKGLDVTYTCNGKTEKIVSVKSFSIKNISSTTGNNNIALRNNKNNTLYVRVIQKGILPVGEELEISGNLVAQTIFKTRDGKVLNVSSIPQGTEMIGEVTITNTSNTKVNNVALSQILPSGFEIVNTRYTDFGSFGNNIADYIDIRDDRANYYFSLNAQETKVYKILINASYLGKYYLPGIQAEAMYDNRYISRTKGKWVEIVK